LASMPAAFSGVRRPRTYRSFNRRSLSWSSTPARHGCLASLCPTSCLWPPTR
jgi:hypothetical protein